MERREVVTGLLNGIYKMFKSSDYDLITKNIYKCPLKVADPLVRAILGYGYLCEDRAIEVLLACFDFYKANYGNDQSRVNLAEEAVKVKNRFTDALEKHYASIVLTAMIDEIGKETA